jgi:hypothetical protein
VRRLMRPVGGRRRRGCAGGSGVDHSLRGLIVALPARADDLEGKTPPMLYGSCCIVYVVCCTLQLLHVASCMHFARCTLHNVCTALRCTLHGAHCCMF